MIRLYLPARRPRAKRCRFDNLAVLAVSRHRLAIPLRIDLVVRLAKKCHELTERHLILPHVEWFRDADPVPWPFTRQQRRIGGRERGHRGVSIFSRAHSFEIDCSKSARNEESPSRGVSNSRLALVDSGLQLNVEIALRGASAKVKRPKPAFQNRPKVR